MIIDCNSCVMRQISCADCVVTVLLNIGGQSSTADDLANKNLTKLSQNQESAINNLASAGLVPPLRFAK
jgi:hypothetical protein